tara:strand:+ start:1815 stop:1964 length:150 start_codon:yes stop_codon:yes gene_type:complete
LLTFYNDDFKNKTSGLKYGLGEDGVHPSIKGYLIIEGIIEKEIRKALNK